MMDTLASVIISLWIVLADTAFVCDSRSADFLINVCNGVYYSVFASYVASHLITSPRILYLSVKIVVPSVLSCVQVVLAAVAHFSSVGNQGDMSTVHFCYHERSSTTVVVSYCYGFALLVLCTFLLFAKLYRDRNWGGWNPLRKLGVCATILLAVGVTLVHVFALENVVSHVYEANCAQHAGFLMLLAFFPAILSMCLCIAGFIRVLYKQKYEMSGENGMSKHK
jgi:hypothetical protein